MLHLLASLQQPPKVNEVKPTDLVKPGDTVVVQVKVREGDRQAALPADAPMPDVRSRPAGTRPPPTTSTSGTGRAAISARVLSTIWRDSSVSTSLPSTKYSVKRLAAQLYLLSPRLVPTHNTPERSSKSENTLSSFRLSGSDGS